MSWPVAWNKPRATQFTSQRVIVGIEFHPFAAGDGGKQVQGSEQAYGVSQTTFGSSASSNHGDRPPERIGARVRGGGERENGMKDIISAIKTHRFVVIYRGMTPEQCLVASQALLAAGVNLFEVTLNSERALEAIELLRDRLPQETAIGAGTVLSADDVSSAAHAGAEFIISPNISREVIEKTKEIGLASIPGGFSATEVQYGWELGADMLKVFPINAVGADYLTQLRGPLDQIPLMPTGKVDRPEFVTELFDAGASAVGVGAHLLLKGLSLERDQQAVQDRARDFIRATQAKALR